LCCVCRTKEHFEGRDFGGQIVRPKKNFVQKENNGRGSEAAGSCGRRRVEGNGHGHVGQQTAVVRQTADRGGERIGSRTAAADCRQTTDRLPTVQQQNVSGEDQRPEKRAELARSVQTAATAAAAAHVKEQEKSFAGQSEIGSAGPADTASSTERGRISAVRRPRPARKRRRTGRCRYRHKGGAQRRRWTPVRRIPAGKMDSDRGGIGEEEETRPVLFVWQRIRHSFIAVPRTSVSQGTIEYILVNGNKQQHCGRMSDTNI